MTHPHSSEHVTADPHTAPPAGPAIFPPAEVAAFQAADKKAATYIICLMAGIFIIGVILYVGVCLSLLYYRGG
jgi:hypothetical protein